MKKILLFGVLFDYQAEIKAAAPEYEVIFVKTEEEAAVHLPEAEIFVDWQRYLDNYELAGKTALKWVQLPSAGADKMPLASFKEHGVVITSTSGMHAMPITEYVFSMMLAFARELHVSMRNQQNHYWDSKSRAKGGLSMLNGKTIGVLGAGAIGAGVAKMAAAFNMRVIGCRRSGEALPGYEAMYSQAQLTEFLPQCDYVVNILPSTPETYHTMDDKAFDAMKPGAYYVSAGRGPTTSNDALMRALESGRLRGAGLDVTDPEPLNKESPLWDLENVIITPHNAGYRPDNAECILEVFLENLKSYLENGKPCRNIVNLDLAY